MIDFQLYERADWQSALQANMTVTSWNLDAPPGFQGLRPDLPLEFYVRHLPHWRQDGATYFVTFRLSDSVPQSKLRELNALRQQFAAKHGLRGTDWQSVLPRATKTQSISNEEWEAFSHSIMQKVEAWLDQGMGSCHLKDPEISRIVANALHFFDGETYELDCYVVMPNHVHAVIRPLRPRTDPLEKVLQSRKLWTSREINAALALNGTLWKEESFDRIIRDEEHLYRCILYIGENPRKAGLCAAACPLWIRPEWEKLGWRFEQHGS